MLLCVASLLAASSLIRAAPQAPAATPASALAAIKAAAMAGDYAGDLPALARVRADALAYVDDPNVGYLARYWAGYASWRSALNGAYRRMPVTDQRAHAEAALRDFEASVRLRPGFADGYAAAASSAGFLIPFKMNDRDAVIASSARVKALLAKALELEPDNPRVLWVQGGDYLFKPAQVGGDPVKALAIYRRATQVASDRDAASPVPDWGEAEAWMALAYAHINQSPPDATAAARAAEEALRLQPGWSYVREILIPQIRSAGRD